MNYLSGALRYVAGGESETQNHVPRIIDRIKSSALPHDRRAAITLLTDAAKSSPDAQVQVGDLGLKVIYAVLEQDSDYEETVQATLDLLIAICGVLDPPPPSSTSPSPTSSDHPVQTSATSQFQHASLKAAASNIDAFLRLPNALSLLLHILEKDDFYIKFATIELLAAMAANARPILQKTILEAPQGVSRLSDLLEDTRRPVRSNAVLLLSSLCDGSVEICKILTFAGILEKLFLLIDAIGPPSDHGPPFSQQDDDHQDDLEAAIVVQDVFLCLRNLIQGTNTTKTFLRDTACIPRIIGVLQRAAIDANMISPATVNAVQSSHAGGVKIAIEKQSRKNLVLALTCVTILVKEADEESNLVKNDLTSAKFFETLARLAFFPMPVIENSGKLPDYLLQVKIAAFKTISKLVRGHEGFRSLFGSVALTEASRDQSMNSQIAALDAMYKDPSAAIRMAAYSAVRESFVVDAGLDLPSSALLNALSTSSTISMLPLGETQHFSHPSSSVGGDLGSENNSILRIAESLKNALIGWPDNSDAAAVFYASALLSWLLKGVEGAKERLLGSYVNGSSLLPQIIRVLGKMEREKGPPEVRISLFSLACIWLHGSPSAVSAFLSSAMHVPMVVDVINSSGSRGDIAEVHTRGLAASLLGICLQATEGPTDPSSGGRFSSGSRGPSTVISQAAIADVIRNRIGVTVFTGCLDDLMATRAFSDYESYQDLWKAADILVQVEEKDGFLSSSGNIGHENWYNSGIVGVINSVYTKVGEKALDLIAERNVSSGTVTESGNRMVANGYPNDTNGQGDVEGSLLADSARDEVLRSYKEFIRTQDENLNGAKMQIEELTSALRETQLLLDSKTNDGISSKDSDALRELQKEKGDLKAQNDALEALLEEKTADFSALSSAFEALEEENATQAGEGLLNSDNASQDLESLQGAYVSLKALLDSEVEKNISLMNREKALSNELRIKDVEIRSISAERDALVSDVPSEFENGLEWKTKAKLSEAKLAAQESFLSSLQSSSAAAEGQLRSSEQSRNEALSTIESLKHKLEQSARELQTLHATRERELRISRDSADTKASTEKEIAELTHMLAEAQHNLLLERSTKKDGATAHEELEHLKSDHQELLKAFDYAKVELSDLKSAVTQWQRRAESNESAKERYVQETNRLSTYVQELETQANALRGSVATHSQSCDASKARVSELEQQLSEMEEIRHHLEEEAVAFKEQLASRTEQTIRLSGQLYETEESKVKLEEQVHSLEDRLKQEETARLDEEASLHGVTSRSAEVLMSPEVHAKLASLQQELGAAQEALSESRDRESLSQARLQDREAAISKIAELEAALNESQANNRKSQLELGSLRESMLSLEEAEEAKRSLTMQVVSLQKALELSEVKSLELESEPFSLKSLETDENLNEKLKEMEVLSDERKTRIHELESSLKTALTSSQFVKRENSDLEKQVAESDAIVSVLQTERKNLSQQVCDLEKQMAESDAIVSDLQTERGNLSQQVEDLSKQLDEIPAADESDSAHVQDLEIQLDRAEKSREAVSIELTSLIEACKLSESEAVDMKKENMELQNCLKECEKDLNDVRIKYKNISLFHEVEGIVSSVILEAALTAQAANTKDSLQEALRSKGEAVASNLKILEDCQHLMSEVELMQSEVQGAVKERDVVIIKSSEQQKQLSKLSSVLASADVERNRLVEELGNANNKVQQIMSENAANHLVYKEAQAMKNSEQQSQISKLSLDLANADTERDRLIEDLGNSNGKVQQLMIENAANHLALNEAQARIEESTGGTEPSLEEWSQKRVVELEEALRDAAKTVSATNIELMAAQALLVEISSDKTAIRTELTSAQQEIFDLKRQIEVRQHVSRDAPSHDSPLSKLSEQDDSAKDVGSATTWDHTAKKVSEEHLRTAQAEVFNYKMALSRSISEADSASNLLPSIFTRVEEIEEKLRTSRVSLDTSRHAELGLQEELKGLKLLNNEERIKFIEDLDTLNVKILDNECIAEAKIREIAQELSDLQLSSKLEKDQLHQSLSDQICNLNSVRERCRTLEGDALNMSSKLTSSLAKLEKLEEERNDMSLTIRTMKEELASNEKELYEVKARESAALEALDTSRTELAKAQDKFDNGLVRMKELHREEKLEFETEIDRICVDLESAERKLRMREASLKMTISKLEEEKLKSDENLYESEKKLRFAEIQIADVRKEKLDMKDSHANEIRRANDELLKMTSFRDKLRSSLQDTKVERDLINEKLSASDLQLQKTNNELGDVHKSMSMLESENEDFLNTIESFENSSKRLKEELMKKTQELKKLDEAFQQLILEDRNNCRKMKNLREDIGEKERDIKILRTAKAKTEDRMDELRAALDKTERGMEQVEQDNRDLREWVSDLERQATELQGITSDFEEVEQSLRETLESQRKLNEDNAKLKEEMKREKESVSKAGAAFELAMREKEAAESTRDSSQRRAQDLETRIRQIREQHVENLSSSEDTMRAKAQRCAELETALASTERKLAELGGVSDELFAARSEIRQRDEDMKCLTVRVEDAESKADKQREEMRLLRAEIGDMRGRGTGDAYRLLEAEHTELLVYLADLELEVTSLREELGRE